MDNTKLIYSHKNKGLIDFNDYNDNIIDFYYDKNTKKIDFRAMNDGEFSLFSITEGEEPVKIGGALNKRDYIRNQQADLTATEKKGSIYIVENRKERCVKRFYGIYDDKFTGYEPIGFSPDGKDLIYRSMEHLTPLGSLAHNLINDSISNVYIMDLGTCKSAKFIDAYNIQWVMDVFTVNHQIRTN